MKVTTTGLTFGLRHAACSGTSMELLSGFSFRVSPSVEIWVDVTCIGGPDKEAQMPLRSITYSDLFNYKS